MSSSRPPFMDLYSSKAMIPESPIYLLLNRLCSRPASPLLQLGSPCISPSALRFCVSWNNQDLLVGWVLFLTIFFSIFSFFSPIISPRYGIRYFDLYEQK